MARLENSNAILTCLLLFFLLIKKGTFAEKNKYYHISTLCLKELNRQMYKKIDGCVLTSEGEENLECVITFQTDTILQKFMLKFQQLALDCNDHLYIFDGAHAFGNYKADLSCRSTRADVGTIFTQSNFVTLKYQTDKWTQAGNGFKLTITTFKDSPPVCKDFKCMNLFCISKDLICDGVDHCGDNSDETSYALCHDSSIGDEVFGIGANLFSVIMVLLFLCCMCVSIAVILICRKSHREEQVQRGQNTTSLATGQLPYQAPKYADSPDQLAEKPPPYPGESYSPSSCTTCDGSLYYAKK